MRRLDADDDAAIFPRHVGRRLGFHVVEIVLELGTAHAGADDIEEREHARLRSIDDALLEVLEVAPAGAPRVGDRRHAGAKREAVGVHAVVAGVGSLLARPRKHVRVDVDETGHDLKARDVDRLRRVGRIDLRRDGGDLPGRDRDIARRADVVARIDHVPAAQQQLVSRRLGAAREPEGHQQQNHETHTHRQSPINYSITQLSNYQIHRPIHLPARITLSIVIVLLMSATGSASNSKRSAALPAFTDP